MLLLRHNKTTVIGAFMITSNILDAISTFSTLFAVFVSLRLANRRRKRVRIHNTYTMPGEGSDQSFKVTMTIENVGEVPIIIDACGILISSNKIEETYNKYITPDSPIGKIVKANDATTIEYDFGNDFDKKDKYGYRRIFLENPIFTVRDTTNRI